MAWVVSTPDVRRTRWAILNWIAVIAVLLLTSGCDHWIEKLEPGETGFARHCFDLLQRRDFAAIEDLADSRIRGDLLARLDEMAELIPAEAPISSDAVGVNVSTNNGYTKSSVSMVYQYPSGWLEFDIVSEGQGDARTLTWIDLKPTDAREAVGLAPLLAAIPAIVFIAALIGAVIYRRRAAKREGMQATPVEQAQRQHWSRAIEDIGRRSSWLERLLGIRRVTLISALNPEECHRRLSISVGSEALFRFKEPPRSEVQGWVKASRFRITRKRSILLAGRYPLFLYGTLSADRTGTQVTCWLGPQRLVLGIAAGFLLFIWLMIPIVDISHGSFEPSSLIALLGPLVMTGFVVLGLALNGRAAVKAGPYLLDFLAQTLEATEAPAARSGSIERVISR